MKLGRLLVTIGCLALAQASFAQDKFSAFGVDEGAVLIDKRHGIVSKSGIVGVPSSSNTAILTTVPKAIPQAIAYEATFTEKTGVCAVGAFIPDVGELSNLLKILNTKYGKSKFLEFNKAGGFNREMWIKDSHPKLPKNLFGIEIIEGHYMDHVIPVLTYYYQNFPECMKVLQSAAEDVL